MSCLENNTQVENKVGTLRIWENYLSFSPLLLICSKKYHIICFLVSVNSKSASFREYHRRYTRLHRKGGRNLILNHVKEIKDHLRFFKAWLVFTEDVWINIWGGVRLRSRLSAGGAQNQKRYFKAKTKTFFINSYKLWAYDVNSYKKLDQ